MALRAVLAAAVMFGALGVASPAQAAWTNCARGDACMWQGTTYPGSPNAYFAYHMSLAFFKPSNNEVSSVVNHGYCGTLSTARFFDGDNYNGDFFDMYCLESGRQMRDPYLANGTNYTSAYWDNRISSASFI